MAPVATHSSCQRWSSAHHLETSGWAIPCREIHPYPLMQLRLRKSLKAWRVPLRTTLCGCRRWEATHFVLLKCMHSPANIKILRSSDSTCPNIVKVYGSFSKCTTLEWSYCIWNGPLGSFETQIHVWLESKGKWISQILTSEQPSYIHLSVSHSKVNMTNADVYQGD